MFMHMTAARKQFFESIGPDDAGMARVSMNGGTCVIRMDDQGWLSPQAGTEGSSLPAKRQGQC